jgi:hypothetical protein
VNKPVPLVQQFERFCNDCKPGSFDQEERKVDFGALDRIDAHTVGLFGRNEELWELLGDKGTLLLHLCTGARGPKNELGAAVLKSSYNDATVQFEMSCDCT